MAETSRLRRESARYERQSILDKRTPDIDPLYIVINTLRVIPRCFYFFLSFSLVDFCLLRTIEMRSV